MLSCCFFLSHEEQIHNKKHTIVEEHEPRLAPGNAAERNAGKGPEHGRGKKLIGMRGNVDKDMQKPPAKLPNGPFEDKPDAEKHRKKYDGAVADAVERIRQREYPQGVLRGRLSHRGMMGKVGCLDVAQQELNGHPR